VQGDRGGVAGLGALQAPTAQHAGFFLAAAAFKGLPLPLWDNCTAF
jgi:hypothetical protein